MRGCAFLNICDSVAGESTMYTVNNIVSRRSPCLQLQKWCYRVRFAPLRSDLPPSPPLERDFIFPSPLSKYLTEEDFPEGSPAGRNSVENHAPARGRGTVAYIGMYKHI